MIIDTHCHLNDKRFQDDLEDVIKRAKDSGIYGLIIPGADPNELPKAVEIAQKHEGIYFAVGVHPYDLESFDIDFLKEYIDHPKCIAVGECGLDYYRLPKEKELKEREKRVQKEIFTAQIELAKEYKKPLIVHIREASNDSLEILKEQNDRDLRGVLHCYNASEILLQLADDGFYFGIGGVITFKNAKKLVEVLPKIPIDKILFETDAPYLSPHPHRGERNEPAYTTFVAAKVAEILRMEPETLKNIVLENTKKLFQVF